MHTSLSKKSEKTLYWIVVALLALGIGIWFLFKITGYQLHLPGCFLLKMTGFYCPGCGGTRAFLFMLKGHFLASVYCHPVVMYAAAVGGWYMISHTIEYLSKEKYAIGMRYRDIYLYIALAIILINWLIKNLFLILGGIRLI